jgi:hypothetical protein
MARRDSFARKEATQRLVKVFKTAVEWDSWGQIEEANKVGRMLTVKERSHIAFYVFSCVDATWPASVRLTRLSALLGLVETLLAPFPHTHSQRLTRTFAKRFRIFKRKASLTLNRVKLTL